MRIGTGYDSHRLVTGRPLILGGVRIPHDKGLLGHSDADALVHAIIDSIIGALGQGDIGRHFPDTDPRWKNADSIELLKATLAMAEKLGYAPLWVDTTILCQAPKLAPHIPAMLDRLRSAGLANVNIKAKTNEEMGFIGRGEGIAAMATCLLKALN